MTSYIEINVQSNMDGIEKIESTLKFAHVYGKHSNDKRVGYEDELEVAYFSGYINKDIAFLHKSSKTLIQADLLFNLPATEQYGSKEAALSGIARLVHTHFSPHSRLHRWLLMAGAKDKAAMKRDASTVADWEFNRVIPCHGDIIETGGKQAWLSAYESFLSPEGHKTN
ncbi:hypothetical protein NEOLI_003359 [Neolecta irregularis DAH-3]|uniref:Uncharacterized protein n=1 Tax=Neolecta irregularis (strain DAH-3) TaxID=1198029 RepID=A0A1U7LN04_NEOID|nr:hypothetical protein NEOLI_003359 [Neolecta irregularis DAH-3]|eukprot:OLL24019.1 hypothetical protein NEOLI_003359 [Neolecta irregularis DAH-3]